MVTGSLSLLSSSLLPSNSSSDLSPPSTSIKFRYFSESDSSFRRLKYGKSIRFAPSKISCTASSGQFAEDGPLQLFAGSNSIADFMRFKRGSDGTGGELQTAVVSYRKRFPWSLLQPFFQVDLVSTIHIADKDYFRTIQKELESYDCVLYEMVTSRESLENRSNPTSRKNTKASHSRGFNLLGCIQRQMARALTLDFQLDCLDYQPANWYHADLDFETFKKLQQEKGESFFTFARDMTLKSAKAMLQLSSIPKDLEPWKSKLLRTSRVLPMPLVGLFIITSVCADAPTSDFPEIEALSRLDLGAAMKVFLAKRLTSELTQVTADVEEGSVIIGDRNRAATEALKRAIDEGNNKIAILYGGGHMPDLGRRLREEFELVPANVEWITAWSIRNRKLDSTSIPILENMAKVSGWPFNRYQTLALLIFSSVLALDLWFWELFFGSTVNWISQLTLEVYHYFDNWILQVM